MSSWAFQFEELKLPAASPGIFDRKELCHFQIRSLTPQQAAGKALAFAVHNPHHESGLEEPYMMCGES
jgi:hypothetical protein